MEEKQKFFKIKDVSGITGLSEHSIRNWCRDFNIQLTKTEGGQRKFTEDNIKVLKAIQERKEVNGWSMKQISAWLNGELTPEVLASAEFKSNLEKKFESLEESISDEVGGLKEAVLLLAKKLDDQEKRHQQEKLEMIDRIEKRIADPVEKRVLELTNSLNESLEQRRLEVTAAKEKEENEQELHNQKEKLGPISRILSKFGL